MVAPAMRAQPASVRPLRLAVLFALICLGAAGIGGRLVYWQVYEAGPLQKKLTAQHTLDEPVPASRGSIRDTNGDLLAGNLAVDYVYAVPNQVKKPEEAALLLSPILGVPGERLFALLSDKDSMYVRLTGSRRIQPEVSEQVRNLQLAGIFLEPATSRVYPEKQLAAHLLGFVDAENQGWYGLEGQYEKVVGGSPGHIRAEKDTAGNEIGFSNRDWQAPVDGQDLVLTIDRTIQYIAERELERAIVQHRASGGTVIVMRPRTGEILAMASRPAFDPNAFQSYADHPEVFMNPAVTSLYEPGSTFKVVTMATALNEKIVTPETTYADTGILNIGGYSIRNWNGKANGITNMTQLLEKSSNIGASWVAFKTGKEKFYHYVATFGFGKPTGIDLQGEAEGIVKNPNAKDWAQVDLATNSFGQAISVTPIQMITAVSAVANGGIMMRPYVVKRIEDPTTHKAVRTTEPQIVRQVVSRDTAATLLNMLWKAAENGETRGTLVPGYRVAGKTGTASIPVSGGYDPSLTIASFIGAVPANDPQFVVLVKIDKPTDEPWGSLIAKPAFAIIAQELTRYLKVPIEVRPLAAAVAGGQPGPTPATPPTPPTPAPTAVNPVVRTTASGAPPAPVAPPGRAASKATPAAGR